MTVGEGKSGKEKVKMSKQEMEAEQKVVTKYDRKMQKRREQKEKELKEKRRSRIVSGVIIALLVAVIASFPIRTYFAIKETYLTIGGEEITRVEFDYNYNVVVGNYVTQYSSYLPYMGLDTTKDFSTQMYSDTLSWKDYFEEMTVTNLLQAKGVKAQAAAAGFTYDTAEEFADFETALKKVAAENGLSVNKYVKQNYGSYATLKRIAPFVKENIAISAYYDKLAEDNAPTEEAIQSYYEENKSNYDSVDYRMTVIQAELPTEPTELADTTEAVSSESTTYTPSDAEVEKAMEEARVLAEEAETKVANAGEAVRNVRSAEAAYVIRDWLFDEARTAGETTIIEDSSNSQYYVLAFEQRYLDQTPSADVRVIALEEGDGQAILDEWQSKGATEESFAVLAKEYSADSSAADGGLYEGTTSAGMPEEISTWLFDSARQYGDTTAITTSDNYTFVLYYVGENDPEWKLSIHNTLVNEKLTEIVEEAEAAVQLEDTKGNLNYLKVQAAAEEEEAAEADTASEATEASTEENAAQ